MKRAKQRPPALSRPPRQRNPVARSPLLGKGGPHERTASAKRQQAIRELRRAIDEFEKE